MQKYFCPKCHVEVVPPEFANKLKTTGNIVIMCGNCKKGKVTITPENTLSDNPKYTGNAQS